ncbi:MAG TPA: YbhB/YbcL family Raf kinase inhibitor-like protein [Actinomycetota bacterium]|nr:YbhB/YbcL family Raf kinase inhibitor-like protein [Actinomycetota bacterium]
MTRLACVALALAVACSQDPQIDSSKHFRVVTEAFDPGGRLPPKYTCDGDDVVPSLGWEALPPDTKSLAASLTDEDADGFVHWVAVGIPDVGHFTDGALPTGAVQGSNDFGSEGYRGPCPPPGDAPHHYVFTFYGLDKPSTFFRSSFHAGDPLDEMLDAIRCCVTGTGTITATYDR